MFALILCLLLQDPPLSKEDKDLLDLPFQDGLLDPVASKAKRVLGTATLRTCYGRIKTVEAPAWRVPAEGGRPARFVLNNLQEVPTLGDFKPATFPAGSLVSEFQLPSFAGIGVFGHHDNAQHFVWAAWLHRLGRDEEAAKILRVLPKEKILLLFRTAFGWELFSHAVNAYIVGDDKEAIPALERLSKFESPYRHQEGELLAELRRRQNVGTFGKRSLPLPADLRSWPLEKRIERLILALDQIENNKDYPGDINLDDQPPARELLACGEAAVPALLKSFEEDSRLTRSVGVWREWDPYREFLSVRGAVACILIGILKTNHWDTRKNPPDASLEDANGVRVWSESFRRYWDEFGKTPFPERMMLILKDKASTVEAIREASENLVRLDRTPGIGRWRHWIPASEPITRELRPELSTFKDPTTAEAILAAMDRHLNQVAGIGNWGELEEVKYIALIGELGDRRITPELLRRLDAKKFYPALVRQYAFALRRLGVIGPLDDIAKEVEDGRKAANNDEAAALIEVLGRGSTPACEKAMAAIVHPKHPWYARTRNELMARVGSADHECWFAHPYCISLLSELLQEKTHTGGVLTVEDGQISRRSEAGAPMGGFLYLRGNTLQPNPHAQKKSLFERTCDVAAGVLAELIPEAPRYDPFLADADARLEELREYMVRNQGKLRRMTTSELSARSLQWYRVYYISSN